MSKTDNSQIGRKIHQRVAALQHLEDPRVLETCGGYGKLFWACYSRFTTGVVFEKQEDRARVLAADRPNWSVYATNCEVAMRAGVGSHHQPNFFDVDPYGVCWNMVDAIWSGIMERCKPERAVMCVTDGTRFRLRRRCGWSTDSRLFEKAVKHFGNDGMYGRYLAVCRWLMETTAGEHGYMLSRWEGYYGGSMKQQTYFSAVFDRAG